jgi:hypothetical protein
MLEGKIPGPVLANIGNSWLKKWTWSSSWLIEELFKLAPFLLEDKIEKINNNNKDRNDLSKIASRMKIRPAGSYLTPPRCFI